MLTKSQKRAYLERIKFKGDLKLSFECLCALHLAHIKSVPFENLDILLNRSIALSKENVLNKILEEKRGGFCYELNYGFSLLLNSLGFQVNLLSARVFNGTEFGKEFDHLLLLITLEQQCFIADVGFGDSFREPLKLGDNVSTQMQVNYKIELNDDCYMLRQQKNNEKWETQYAFTLQNYEINDFEEMCKYHQISPTSSFTRKSVCTLATDDGRVTISNGRLIITSLAGKTQKPIINLDEYKRCLWNYFNLVLPANLPVENLLSDTILHNNQSPKNV